MSKKRARLIISFAVIAVLFIASLLCGLLLFSKSALKAEIFSDGILVDTILLNENKTFTVNFNSEYNIIIVKDGYIWVEEGSCRGNSNRCDEAGKINKAGQMIVCEPNRLIIHLIK